MILQIASDLHLEMHRDLGLAFLKGLDPTGVDVLVLAGDIFSAQSKVVARLVFSKLAEKYPHLVYVPGNHEFYQTSPREAWTVIKAAAKDFPNVHVLDNGVTRIDGQRFIGGTGWFPFDASAVINQRFMNDFRMIRNFDPWVYESNQDLDCLLHGGATEASVVVTHHLPIQRCIDPRWANSALNPFFVSDFEDALVTCEPKLWIHGHTHEQVDFMYGKTRVVANPYGYPKEVRNRDAFQPRLLIEV